jgi:hypothetical protein
MTRHAEEPKARINPALLFSDAISPQDAAKTEAGTSGAASEHVSGQRSGYAEHCGVIRFADSKTRGAADWCRPQTVKKG